MFYSPSTTPAAENWAINFSNYMVANPSVGSHINLISQAAQALSFARVRMVRNNDSKYAGLWDNTALPAGDPGAYASTYFIPYMLKDGIPFRMEETNSYSNHGAEGASDAYAAALWGYRYVASNLNPGTTYFCQVSCIGSGGSSLYSTPTSNTTGASVGDGIPGWRRLQYFGNGLSVIAGVSGPQDDPGSSGIPNLLAYATGTSPTGVNSTLVTTLDTSTAKLELKFNRIDPPTLTYKVEASPDLAGWMDIAWLKPDGSPWSGPATTIPVAETGTGSTRAVTVIDSQLKQPARADFSDFQS